MRVRERERVGESGGANKSLIWRENGGAKQVGRKLKASDCFRFGLKIELSNIGNKVRSIRRNINYIFSFVYL